MAGEHVDALIDQAVGGFGFLDRHRPVAGEDHLRGGLGIGEPGAEREGVDVAQHLRSSSPSPEAYELIGEVLGTAPNEVLFVSSNPWDAAGAKSFGLNVAWIERVTPEAMALACVENELVAPLTMFKAIRTQMDELGFAPDHRVRSLSELPGVA